MTICLVTDRRRLAGAETPFDQSRECLIEQARRAVEAGVDLLHIRERDLEAATLSLLVRDIVRLARGTATRVVVNDRVDVALASGADGVHLRGDSLPVGAARRLTPPGFLIGRSVHRVDEAVNAAGADYLVAGTVFPSRSKPARGGVLGLDGLRAIAGATPIPVLAIGGVTEERCDLIAAAGAAGLAAIGLFMGAESTSADAGCRAISVRGIVETARHRFDSLRTTP